MPDPSCAQKRDRGLYFPANYFFAEQRLMNHTIEIKAVKNLDVCEYLCYPNDGCVTLYIKNPDSNGIHKCELNNSIHMEYGRDLVVDPSYYYRGAKNKCGKSGEPPCENQATCQSGFTDKAYHCVCPPGFEGERCENDIDECDTRSHNCNKRGNFECVNTIGSFDCRCKDGYVSNHNGLTCEVNVCQTYEELSDAKRKATHPEVFTKVCDNNHKGWYRFKGAAGKEMATTCPMLKRCGGDFPGWLDGAHPTVAEGIVIRRVCFRMSVADCCGEVTSIEVKNCGSYYIYKLDGTPGCQNRYCGTN